MPLEDSISGSCCIFVLLGLIRLVASFDDPVFDDIDGYDPLEHTSKDDDETF